MTAQTARALVVPATNAPKTLNSQADGSAITSLKSTATEALIGRVLQMLQRGARSTYEFRACGISHPAQRIIDLQSRGWRIDSSRITTVDSDGFRHVNVALYSLVAEPSPAGGQP